MKYSCEIIKDLLPLYHDGVCSEESCNVIREHLEKCEECKEYLNKLDGSGKFTTKEKNTEQAKAAVLRQIKKKFFHKKVVISVISIICAVAVLIGSFVFMNTYISPVQYEKNNITVEIDHNGDIYAYLKGTTYSSAESKTITREVNGKVENNIYFYVSSSFWSKHFGFNASTQSRYVVTYNYISDGQKSEASHIDNVYYFVGDYNGLESLSEDELLKATDKAILVWSKTDTN